MGIGAHICNSGLRKENTLQKKENRKKERREKSFVVLQQQTKNNSRVENSAVLNLDRKVKKSQ